MKPLLLLLLAALPAAAQDAAPAAPSRVLIVGDSHAVGPFGATLDAVLRAKLGEDAVTTYAVCGASSSWWLSSTRQKLSICHFFKPAGSKAVPRSGAYPAPPPAFADLVKTAPDLAILALGSNPDGDPAATVAAAMKMISALPAATRCVWVGPPPMPTRLTAIASFYKKFPDALAASGRSCRLIDSRPFLDPAQSVKDHFYGKPAQDWGRSVAALILP